MCNFGAQALGLIWIERERIEWIVLSAEHSTFYIILHKYRLLFAFPYKYANAS